MDTTEPYAVLIRAPTVESVRDWCLTNVPEEHLPTLTVRSTNNNTFVIRAMFHNQHYAALFRMFWDEALK